MTVAIDTEMTFDSEYEVEASDGTHGSGELGPAKLCLGSWYCIGSYVPIP